MMAHVVKLAAEHPEGFPVAPVTQKLRQPAMLMHMSLISDLV